jgi:hypothetical protein
MGFLKRIIKVPRTAKASNPIILQKANEKRTLITNIRKKKSHFFGHTIRQKTV